MKARNGLQLGALALLLTLWGCSSGSDAVLGGGSSGGSGNPSGASISISPVSAAAGSRDLTLTITGSNFAGPSHCLSCKFSVAVWSANGSRTFLSTTFSSSTKLTAVVPSALLKTTVQAQIWTELWEGGGDVPLSTSTSVPFSVTPPAVAQLSVVLTPVAVTLAPGGTQAFTATVTGANTAVTWAVQEAAGGAVNDAGSYTAPTTAGFYHVLATSVADTTVSGSATVTVSTSPARFTPTRDMQNARGLHTATLLADGRVLMAGGATNALDPLCLGGMASAELYDSSVGSFTSTGSMTSPRYSHTATSLLNGEVLVTGGFGSVSDCEDLGTPVLSSAELYNPASASFKVTGGMFVARRGHTATLLANGKVLVAGGTGQTTSELYDPAAGLFTRTGNMAIPRSGHTATLLANGKVLILGGFDTTDPKAQAVTAAAETYDPITGGFTGTGSMTTARAEHTATLLIDGRVLIAGGVTNAANGLAAVSSVEVYDPTQGSFSPTGGMGQARASHTATLLPNGNVLVTGGSDSTAELYEPSTGSFNTTGSMEIGRWRHTATLLLDGRVLVAGGNARPPLETAELYK